MKTELKAGRELDALIAEKVMGLKVSSWSLHLVEALSDLPTEKEWRHGMFSAHDIDLRRFPTEILLADAQGDMPSVEAWNGKEWANVPEYSTDISDAWKVVDKLREGGWVIDIRIDDEPWERCEVRTYSVMLNGVNRGRNDDTTIDATAETLPLAICLTALRASAVPLRVSQ